MTRLRFASVVLIALLTATTAFAGGPERRVLMVGDSWADFMWFNRNLRDVFAANGRSDIVEEGAVTAISGSTAAEWAQPSFLQSITAELIAYPTIDTVQLTMGGNDFLAGESGGGWYVDISPTDLAALTNQILGDVATVIDHILALDPAIDIVVSLYDYANFEDSFFFPGCLGRYNDLGEPTTRQLNDASIALQAAFVTLVDTYTRVTLVDHTGLMQFTYGFPGDGIAPGTLLPPGNPDLPS
ncbi:MAG: hypothetical protein AAGD38_18480, partial [Acidobacteriota bacterium]